MKEVRVWFCDNFLLKQEVRSVIEKRYRVVTDRKTPRYVFCSVHDFDIYRYRDAVRICYEMENLVPDFSIYDYVMGNACLTFEDRYMRVPDYMACDRYRSDVDGAMVKHRYPEHVGGGTERKFCCMVVSNGTGRGLPQQVMQGVVGI